MIPDPSRTITPVAFGKPVKVKANERGDWTAPLVTEQMRQMGLPAIC